MFLHFLQARSIIRNAADIGRTSQSVILSLWRSFLDLFFSFLSLYFIYRCIACTSASVKTVRCDLVFDEGSSDKILLAQSSSLYPQ